jgi:hypothetical protein
MKGFPSDPLGEGAHPMWVRNLLRFIRKTTIVEIVGAKERQQGTGGRIIDLTEVIQRAAGAASTVNIQLFHVISETPLYLNCYKRNGGLVGTDVTAGGLIKVLKPVELQNVPVQQQYYTNGISGPQSQTFMPLVIGGITSPNKRQTWPYSAGGPATAAAAIAAGLSVFNEVIYLGYISGLLTGTGGVTAADNNCIYGITDGIADTVTGAKWLDMNIDGREWYKETIVCTFNSSGVQQNKLALVRSTATYTIPIDFTTP